MTKNLTLWYDIVNPSDVWFFKPLLSRLDEYASVVTIRDRAETKALAMANGIRGRLVGAHYTDRLHKNVMMPARFVKLLLRTPKFDIGLSFENGLALTACKLRGRSSILFCDNDLKFLESGSLLQDFENKLKVGAEHLVIPTACYDTFRRFAKEDRIVTYDGFKEDVYIADYVPDEKFPKKVQSQDYVIVRPEALDSSYVGRSRSLVPELLQQLGKEGIPVVFLPRERGDDDLSKGFETQIPRTPLNGLDLCYFSRAVLTGSGTMAREAACMGVPAVSFFPGKRLLSVDRKLVEEGRMIHSRNAQEIVQYVQSSHARKRGPNLARSRVVQGSVMKTVKSLLDGV
jgi:predicted glycosyltransferase